MVEPSWEDLLKEASRLRREHRVDEAIAAYRQLLAIKPDLPESWYNLGFLQKQARAFADSLESYARALDLGVTSPEEAHLNRAGILSDHLNRPDDARSELQRALEINRDYVPALLNLGNLQEDLGERESARGAYQRALEVEPANALALARLAGLSHGVTLDRPLAARLEAAIADPAANLADRADLGFALGGLLDAAGRYDESFAAHASANNASRSSTGTALRYDRAAVEAFIDRTIATFRRAANSEASEAAAPTFICGLFRSGSTLVERILATQPDVAPGGELDLIPTLARSISPYPEAVVEASGDQIARWRAAYLAGLPIAPSNTHFVTDKRPDNFLHIGLIKTIFPTARIIHTLRNRLDNLLSLYFLHLGPAMAYALDLDDLAHWHDQYSRLMTHWETLYGADIFAVDYDELVANPNDVVRGLFDFCGLDPDAPFDHFHQRSGAVKTASVWQVREPLHTRSSGRWRNYQRHLAQLRRRSPARLP